MSEWAGHGPDSLTEVPRCRFCGSLEIHAQGLCSADYRWWLRHGKPEIRNMHRVHELRSARQSWAEEVRLVVSEARRRLVTDL